MSTTIHQRVHGYLWHWRTGPGWVRDGTSIRKLRNAGMRVLKVQLQDDGPIPLELVQEWQAAGMQVWGMYWPKDELLDPLHAALWLRQERLRLGLKGLDCNHEDNIRAKDLETGGAWSTQFATEIRRLCPTLPLHFDSYYGSAAGGINLGAYKAQGFRFWIQTFWGADGLWDDPTTRIVQWCAGAQPVIPKSIVKPIFRVAPNNAGDLPDYADVIANTRQAGTKGCGFYYIDGADFDELVWLTKQAIATGIAY